MVTYTDPEKVTDTRADHEAPRNPSRTGYGGKIPTAYWLRYENKWRRVYVMNYGNAGTAYILVKGEQLCLDVDTEWRIKDYQD